MPQNTLTFIKNGYILESKYDSSLKAFFWRFPAKCGVGLSAVSFGLLHKTQKDATSIPNPEF